MTDGKEKTGTHLAELSLRTLDLLAPDAGADFAKALESAVRDCQERPAQDSKREITVKVAITPHPNDADDVEVNVSTSSKLPARKVPTVRARRTPRAQLQFKFTDQEL